MRLRPAPASVDTTSSRTPDSPTPAPKMSATATRRRRLVLLLVGAAAAAGLGVYLAQAGRRGDGALADARAAVADRDFGRASAVLDGYLAAHPRHPGALLLAAQ